MRSERFILEAGDRNAGEVFLPDEVGGRVPVVVYCHGWSSNRVLGLSTQALRDRCLEESMALVSFDFFGCGETGGDYAQMTYGRWTDNLDAVCDWVMTREWADPAKIGCFGISSGTTPSLRLAARGRLAFVVSVATCLGLFIHMPGGPGRVLVENWESLVGGGTATFSKMQFGLEFFRDFVGRAPVYELQSINCPVFFLRGKKDNPWRRADAWLGSEVMSRHGLRAKHLELENGGHDLAEVPDQCAAEVMQWLREIGIIPH